MNRVSAALGIMCSLALLACGRTGTNSATHTFRTYRQAGVRIAETGIGPKYDGELFTYEPVLQLQQVEENPDSYLRYPAGFLQGEDDCYYVPDPGNHRIAVFDSEGRYLRAFGQQGEGPGDLQSFNLQSIIGNILEVFDYSLQRLTRFRTDGSLVEVIQLPRSSESRQACYVLADGRKVLIEYIDPWIPGPQNAVWHRGLVLDADDDTLNVIETDPVANSFRHGPGLRAGTPIPYSVRPICVWVAGRGFLTGRGEEPVLEWFDLEGRCSSRIVLDVPPDEISPELRRSIEARYDRSVERATGQLREFAKQQREGLIIPEAKGWWTDLQIDSAGFIWLSKATAMWEYTLPTVCRVLSPEGEYLGDTTLPAGRVRFQDGLLMGMVTDEETDEEIPTVFRIVPAVAGLDYQ